MCGPYLIINLNICDPLEKEHKIKAYLFLNRFSSSGECNRGKTDL